MDDETHALLPWLGELVEQVERELHNLSARQHDCRPAWAHELEEISLRVKGWSESLAKPNLSPGVRSAMEDSWATALERQQELEALISAQVSHDRQTEQLVKAGAVLERLDRLADVLACNNPTAGNLELSLHLERVECFPDGKVVMRTCKLGTLTEVIELFASESNGNAPGVDSKEKRSRSRRRGRLRVDDADESPLDMRTLADFAADTNRFAGLSDEWFWVDEFQIPGPPLSWAEENAEAVFIRRQETRLSLSKLAAEFGVTAPTIKAAIRNYEATHPGVRDEVRLRAGGKRGPRVDVTAFAAEARALWESGWSKERLAEKFGYSPPTIDKALAFAYEQAGLSMPTRQSQRAGQVASARKLLDDGKSLDEIAAALKVSDVTARSYLGDSFATEGKSMPDLRSLRKSGTPRMSSQ